MADITAFAGYGGWIPKHPDIHKSFITKLVEHALDRANADVPHQPAVADFEKAIKDGGMLPLFNKIFEQVSKPMGLQPSKRIPEVQIESFEQLLKALDKIIVSPPKYEVVTYPNGDVIGEPVGVPILLAFDLLSNTSAAYDLFRMETFNVALKALLDSWGKFLATDSQSSATLTGENGWLDESGGLKSLELHLGKLDFEQTYEYDKDAPNKYKTWDSFFTRKFKPNVRPDPPVLVFQPGRSPHTAQNDPLPTSTIIYSACESTILRVGRNVQLHDKFWLKGQSYSLHDMLDGSRLDEGVDYVKDYIKPFVGGTVYQAFLGPTDYHRWHSPIAGTIVKIVKVPGSYYAVLPDAGAEEGDPDLDTGDPHGALIRSQAFLTVSATRVLFYIKSAIGLVCFIAVGMAEVSTCDVTVTDPKDNGGKPVEVKAGGELGTFRFGGSTSAILFPKEIRFTMDKENGVKLGAHVMVKSALGVAVPVV